MNFGERTARLRTLRMLNEIEEHLGNYLLMVTTINIGVGVITGLICAVTGMPNPAGLGALAAILNFIPIIGRWRCSPSWPWSARSRSRALAPGLLAPTLFAAMTFLEGHFLTPMIVGRRLALNPLAVFIALAFWTWLWGPDGRVPVVAAPDRRADREGASDAIRCAATAGGLADSALGTSPSTGRLFRRSIRYPGAFDVDDQRRSRSKNDGQSNL
jgi:hypothetical protein